jgi:hypothetical protein
MNYISARLTRYQFRDLCSFGASIGVLNSFIPIRYAIGIRSTYNFHFTNTCENLVSRINITFTRALKAQNRHYVFLSFANQQSVF